ncbi:hypothetical protein [Streptomyces subrutilus]|uniref:VCBS repeat-containing protein n=1 Tax=Streptomyces subrutilus TaxID=36818 RepID=A0A5P2UNL8_9ACTN|nr:hypothetical protein [Streptomyces subrutilus]QEU80703.1 hypothetical protein CP968_22595 [Streptomyces subrutilus]WSJ30012.1 hypothetical protein OG479_12225 [Streptomyces subrutilus]GGZ74155.1 hypothetical protein GCM10010371_37390 [Streptomyces subrutilus]
MTLSTRRPAAALLWACACVLAAGGCGVPGGLGPGTPAPPVSWQPHPEPLWPAWPAAPGSAAGRREAPPVPLKHAPKVGRAGLRGVDATEVARADPRMEPYLSGTLIRGPGRSGVRPPVYRDLTGDGQEDLIVAADTPTGRSALSVYAVSGGRIVTVLFTIGRQLTAEALGTDLLVRVAADDGSEQAVRYHWDGDRMTVLNDERRFRAAGPHGAAARTPAPGCPDGDGPGAP